jgi:hypothetical protein
MSAELLDGLRAEDSCEQKKREKQRFQLHQLPPSVVSVSSSVFCRSDCNLAGSLLSTLSFALVAMLRALPSYSGNF